MRPVDPDHNEGLTDEELDAVLASANEELLSYVREKVDPSDLFTAIMAQLDEFSGSPANSAASSLRGDDARQMLQTRSLARALALTLNRASDRAPNLSFARELACTLDRALDLDFTLDRAGGIARALARDLTPDRTLDFDHAHACALELIRALDAVALDVSGLDLSRIDLSDPDVLTGVVWSPETEWPLHIAEEISSRSEEISPGVYQVRGGSERDPVNLGIV